MASKARRHLRESCKASHGKRLGRRLAAYSAATGAVAASAGGLAPARDANAAVVYSGVVNISIPGGTPGTLSSSAQGNVPCTGSPPAGCTASTTNTSYTPPTAGVAPLDLDGAGGPDFDFTRNLLNIKGNFSYPGYSTYINGTFNALGVNATTGNGWIPSTNEDGTFVARLKSGDAIGPEQTFKTTPPPTSMATARKFNLTFDDTFSSSYTEQTGPWNNGTGFVGLVFQSGPNTHYGWARIRILDPAKLDAVIVDYAYNNEAGGETAAGSKGISFVPLPNGTALGLIALGAIGIKALRQRRKTTAEYYAHQNH